MKILNLAFLMLLLAGGAAAQTPASYPDPPDVVVSKNSWHTKARDRKLEEDPLGPTNEQAAADRYRKYEEELKAGRSPTEPVERPSVWRKTSKSTPTVEYFFEATFSNTGTKKIRRIIWEYVFLDPATGREVGYRPFISRESISPGKTKKLVGYVSLPMVNAADRNKAGQESRGKYTERISIRKIEYADNTVWQRPPR